MKQTITETMFIDKFKAIRPDNFSYDGLSALFDYLEEYETETGEEMELDVIEICCGFSEYPSATDAAAEYFTFEGMTYDDETGEELETSEEVETKALDFLQDETTVITFDGGVIIQDF